MIPWFLAIIESGFGSHTLRGREQGSQVTVLGSVLGHIPLLACRFIDVGGYKLLNNWLTYSKTTNNIPLLQQILLTLQHLPCLLTTSSHPSLPDPPHLLDQYFW